MVDKIIGILLVVALGMCVVAFPFVLWMLFGSGPRSRPMRYISRQRENGATEFSVWSEDRKKSPAGVRRGWRVRRPLYVERVTKIILALNVRRL
jgi:hypothetical protein